MASAPLKSSIEKSDRAIQFYKAVVQRVYEKKIKAAKKQLEAVERDEWRYEILPDQVGREKGMTLEQLERLVQWKITHGASRPFLPAMIRKNDAAGVLEATSASLEALSALNDTLSASEALDITLSAMAAASKLTGVGPATASLVLAVYQPELVPFFQDELWAWCFPEKAGTKLKYDKKEYELLFRRCWEIKQSRGKGGSMLTLEKGSFVLQHLDLLTDDETSTIAGYRPREKKELVTDVPQEASSESKQRINDVAAKSNTKRPAPPVRDGVSHEDESMDGRRRSKRSRK